MWPKMAQMAEEIILVPRSTCPTRTWPTCASGCARDPLAGAGNGGRLVAGRPLAYVSDLCRVLGDGVRLARPEARLNAFPQFRPRSTAWTSTSCTSGRPHAGRAAADPHARLARLGRRVPQGHRAAHRPGRARRRPGRRLPRGRARRCPATASAASRPGRLERRANRRRLGRADGPAGLRRATARRAATGARASPPASASRTRPPGRHPPDMPLAPPDPATLDDLTEAGAGVAGRIARCDGARSGYSASSRPGRRRSATAWSTPPRAGRLDPGEVLGLDRPRRHPGRADQPRRAARRRDALLAARHGGVLGPAVLGELRPVSDWFSSAVTDTVDVPTGSRCSRTRCRSVSPLGREALHRHPALERAARGGHFAALEQPDTFVDEVRTFFRLVR